MIESYSPRGFGHTLRITALICSALVTAGCDEISKRIQQATETATAPTKPVRLHQNMAAEAISHSVACLESTGDFAIVPCDQLNIKFEDIIGRKFDAAEEVKSRKNPVCMALSEKRDKKHKKLRTKDGANVRDSEVIFWAEAINTTYGRAGIDFATKAVKGSGQKGRYLILHEHRSSDIFYSEGDPGDFLAATRAKVGDLFEDGSVDLSQPPCETGNPQK